jgi:hypothetical protein
VNTRKPIIDATGLVVNVIEVTDDSQWNPPEGLSFGPVGGERGDVWDGASYRKPEQVAPPLTQQDYSDAVQAHVDKVAREKNYRDGFALASYASSFVSAWALEAQAFIRWRDAVWLFVYEEFDKVLRGDREQPSVEQLIADLPMIEWPEA